MKKGALNGAPFFSSGTAQYVLSAHWEPCAHCARSAWLLTLELSLQRSHGNIFCLIHEAGERSNRVSDRKLAIGWNCIAHKPLQLLADNHEFPAHRLFGPAQSRALRAVTLRNESLYLHCIRQHLRRFARRLLDDSKRAENIRDQRREMIGHLGRAQTFRHRDGRITTNPADR